MTTGLSLSQWLAYTSTFSPTQLANMLDAYIAAESIHTDPPSDVEVFVAALRALAASQATLVVENGTGLANADSYVSLADGEAYFYVYPNAAWTADVTATDKEAALRRATIDIDLLFGSQFAGYPKTTTQALLFPREGDTAISSNLKGATLELAALMLAPGGFAPTAASIEDLSITESSLEIPGAYKRTTKWGNGRTASSADAPALNRVRMFLQPLLAVTRTATSFSLIPVVRG